MSITRHIFNFALSSISLRSVGRLIMLLFITSIISQHNPMLCSAIVACRPILPCRKCETHWLKNYWNPSRYFLCLNGRVYKGLCRDANIFSLTLKCCIRSWQLEWQGCVTKEIDYKPTVTPSIPPNYTGVCGDQILAHIVPAYPSLPGSWPWQVSIQWLNNFAVYEHICGGTLIADQWILTASHCVTDYKIADLRIVLGAYNISNPLSSEIERKHPQYSREINRPNDIALIKMVSRVKMNWKIHPVCLINYEEPNWITDYSDCWITGWGDTRHTGDPNVLNELKVTITDTNSCNSSWQGLILSSHICIGNGVTGACAGDSGGPLVCRQDGRFFQIGITSWGAGGCHTTGLPNVFTWLKPYMDWLQYIMKHHNANTNGSLVSSINV
ncbi:chymotrypsin-like elastase family member 2A isoform X2 [Octopus sinensis]|uniref:Acrosin n=1 Tax=Octopus sinensis TaxID=2607531 RepID=A0A7E6ELN1_9MOLL|nr:chymotrypsin-like elastase family member 2A isoform X2 [Octopus sinensis]